MSMQTIGIAVIVLTLAIFVYVEINKHTTYSKLEAYMREGKYDEFLALLDKRLTQTLYPRYNLLFLRLNAMFAKGDTKQAVRVVEEMRGLKMNKEQRMALAVRAFSLFVEVQDEKNALKELEYIEENGDKTVAVASRRTYEVFFKGSSAYIEDLEQALKSASRGEEALICQMLAVQYENRGDKERARSYQERALRIIDESTGK